MRAKLDDLSALITKRIDWHTLRHTFGTLLRANGADVATVQALMRHRNASAKIDRCSSCDASETRSAAQYRGTIGPKWTHAAKINYRKLLNRHGWALNSAVECHLHTVEVIGSNPIAPTILLKKIS